VIVTGDLRRRTYFQNTVGAIAVNDRCGRASARDRHVGVDVNIARGCPILIDAHVGEDKGSGGYINGVRTW
jgi:hypothetical protein